VRQLASFGATPHVTDERTNPKDKENKIMKAAKKIANLGLLCISYSMSRQILTAFRLP
jgi:hypothetical protein